MMDVISRGRSLERHRIDQPASPEFLVFSIVSLSLVFETLSGPLRISLDSVGAYPLFYFPKVLMAMLSTYFLSMSRRFSVAVAVFLILLLFAFINSFANLPSLFEPFFAAWVLIPLIFSVCSASYVRRNLSRYFLLFRLLFTISIMGIFINYFIDFPWTGSEVKFAGQNLEASRDWATGEYSRISGFSRASFNAATQVLAYSIFVMASTKGRIQKIFLWTLVGLGVITTTTKGAFVSYIILSFFFLTNFLTSYFGQTARRLFNLSWKLGFFALIFLDIYVPITTISNQYRLDTSSSPARTLLLASFGDRMNYTWPEELKILSNSMSWLFGKGIGAIGAAQGFVTPAEAWPGDNLFVYLVVQYGITGSLLVFCLLFLSFRRLLALNDDNLSKTIGTPILLLIVSYGFVANICEDPVLAFMLGLVIIVGKNRVILDRRFQRTPINLNVATDVN